MKIGLTGYPLAQLTGGETLKKAGTGVKKGSADRVDVPVLSNVPDKAIVRYLRTVDEILSDIIRIVDDDASLPGGEETAAISQKTFQQAAITPRDAVIYLPAGVPAGEEGPEGLDEQLIIIKDVLSAEAKDIRGRQGEIALVGFAKEIADELSRIDTGMTAGAVDINAVNVRDKFIVSVDAAAGIPVYSVIRHDPSGGTVLYHNTAEGLDDAAAASTVAKIASFLTRNAGETLPESAAAVPDGSLINMSDGRRTDDSAASLTRTDLAAGKFALPDGFDPVKAAKEVASFLSAGKSSVRSDKAQDDKSYDIVKVLEYQAPANDTLRSDDFPGITIRVIPSTALAAASVKTAGVENRQEVIAERFASLADVIGTMIEYEEDDEGGPGEGQVRLEAMRTSVKEAVRESLYTAIGSGKANQAGPLNETLEGIGIDEKGLLKVDKKVFAGTLMERKDEASRFVHNFGNTLHDKVAYFFHPFAGLYDISTGEAGVRGPGSKDGIADEEEETKAKFEKRLNEIQLLLESSYELKESFMNTRLSGRTGPDGEQR
ncbi:MAG TPA: hypothetical protein PLR60_01995 [Syntrophorhabdaceae bacterium]|nr:hypothetical protein [Syntrophorhabdaceae bacterium]